MMLTYLLFGGGSFMVIMSVIWLAHPDKSALNRYFAAMYSSTGFVVLYAWAERTSVIYALYPLYNMQIPLCFVFAPLIYYGFKQIADLDCEPIFYWQHFLPFILSIPIILAINILNAPLFAHLPPDISPYYFRSHSAFRLVHFLGLASNLYIFYFLTLIITRSIPLLRDNSYEMAKELKLLVLFVGLFFLDVIGMMVAHFMHDIDLLHLSKFLSSLTFILYALYSFRYPEFTQKIVRKSKTLRYRHSQLRGLNQAKVLERLTALMETEHAYREMGLSIRSLSKQLSVTVHQLSEILNDCLRQNFSAYLNGYRIREAQALLTERPETSVLEIAFEVGFNSKASFNTHFLRTTGKTPSEYRKTCVNRSKKV